MNWMDAVMDAKKAGAVYPGDQPQKGTTMTEKYIELADPILAEADNSNTTSFCLGVRNALYWLDAHPDQVPGLTITESELSEAAENSSRWTDEGVGRDVLSHFGIEVVPDPEPTNAEKINEAYDVWDRDPQDLTFGEYLDRLGWVKAPGGDDDH